jgi:ketosteroid isomerase-like protein
MVPLVVSSAGQLGCEQIVASANEPNAREDDSFRADAIGERDGPNSLLVGRGRLARGLRGRCCVHLAVRLESVAVPTSLSQPDLDHIRKGYRLFTEGDPAFLDLYEPDATVVFPGSLPKGGTYGSPLEALAFWNNIGELFESPHAEPEEFIRDRDQLVVLGHFHGRSRVRGEQVAIRFAHVFGLTGVGGPLSEQSYTSFELIIDSAAVLSALAKPGAD